MPKTVRSFLFLLCLALFCTAAPPARALTVSNARFGVHPDKTRLVLDLSETSEFRVFVLSDPYRLVIDLPGFTWKTGALSKPSGTGVTAVRHGNLSPGVSRIVFDFNMPIAVRAAFALPGQSGRPDRLVIDFASIPAAEFAREKEKVYGRLTEQSTNPAQAAANPPAQISQLNAALQQPPVPPPKTKNPLIVIDPGHGGVDPGAIGAHGILEKNVVLALGKELKKQLEATGQYRVIMTRETDIFIKLRDRVNFARQHNADLFVSLHADSIDNHNVSGASFYTLSEKASDAQSARLAANENRADLIAGIDLSAEDEDVASILVDLTMRDTTNQAKFFANTLASSFKSRNVTTLDNAHRHAGFAVLKAPDIPSVLVEAGFMSNNREAQKLNSSDYRKNLSAALVGSIDAYFEQVRKNQRF